MKKNDITGDDLLRKYMNPDVMEEAPSGFTAKIMSSISVEPAGSFSRKEKITAWLVPVAIMAIFLILIIAAVITLNSEKTPGLDYISKALQSVNLKFPDLKSSSLVQFNIPAILLYTVPGLLLLTLFDVGLNRLFRRGKR